MNKLRHAALATGLSLSLVACGGGAEKEATPSSIAATPTTTAKKPEVTKTSERSQMLKELKKKKGEFEADLKDRKVKVKIFAGICAIIGVRQDNGEYAPFLIPNPAFIDIESPDNKLGLTMLVGLDNRQKPIYGPRGFTQTNSDGTMSAEAPIDGDKMGGSTLVFPGAHVEDVEVTLNEDGSSFHESGQEYFALQSAASGLGSVDEFAKSSLTAQLCKLALEPEPGQQAKA